MKRMRILTGDHAGAQIGLSNAIYLLGSGPDADIRITDWKQPAIRLERGGEGEVHVRAAGGVHSELVDFAPRRFGDIVLCVGEEDGMWPTDVDLMERMLTAERNPASGTLKRVDRRAVYAGFVTGIALLGAFTTIVATNSREAQAKEAVKALPQQVRKTLSDAGMGQLSVHAAGNLIAVEGVLSTSTDVSRVRSLLRGYDQSVLLLKVMSATDIARSIEDALHSKSLRVRHQAGGVFVVEGSTAHLDETREQVKKVSADFGSLVSSIELHVTEEPLPERSDVDAAMVDGDVQYVQTGDGIKHLSLSKAQVMDAFASQPQIDLPPANGK